MFDFPVFFALLKIFDEFMGVVTTFLGQGFPSSPYLFQCFILHLDSSSHNSIGVTNAGTNKPNLLLMMKIEIIK